MQYVGLQIKMICCSGWYALQRRRRRRLFVLKAEIAAQCTRFGFVFKPETLLTGKELGECVSAIS